VHVLPLSWACLRAQVQAHLDFSFEEIQRQRNEREVTSLILPMRVSIWLRCSKSFRLRRGHGWSAAMVIFGNVQCYAADFASSTVAYASATTLPSAGFNFSASKTTPASNTSGRIVVSRLRLVARICFLAEISGGFLAHYRRTYRRNVAYEVTRMATPIAARRDVRGCRRSRPGDQMRLVEW